MNRDFLVQLHRNLGIWHDYLIHNKGPLEKDVEHILKVIEKEVKKLPKVSHTLDSRFTQMESALKVICPVDLEWVFILSDQSLRQDNTYISTTLSKEKTESLLNVLLDTSMN